MADSNPDQIDLREVAPAEVAELDPDQHRERIYTRKVEGHYQRIRLYTGWPLLLGYFLLPWLNWADRQAVLFDLPARKFHILGLTFWPQDFPLLALLLIIAAFALFAITGFAGRLWCGYTCPQTVWTSIFMWLEQHTEGSRNQRIKLDRAPWSASKATKKGLKHGSWLFVAFLTGFTFVGYFYPVRSLAPELLQFAAPLQAVFWTGFFTLLTYLNAGWMREQVCKHMCPYARFQSVMFDRDTLIVSYDPRRGDPRGSRKRGADPASLGLGDCIDCELCVQVCPTGIDIRQGLQYECIDCALCIDACNSVMDKMHYPRGLIRYTSERALEGETSHWLRPRVIGYLLVLGLMITLFCWQVLVRVPLELSVIRDRNQLYLVNDDGSIENVYTLRLANMDPLMHEFEIRVEGLPGARVLGAGALTLNGGEVHSTSLRIQVPGGRLQTPSTRFYFTVHATDQDSLHTRHESSFLIPPR